MENNCSFMCSVQGPLLLIFTYQEDGEGGCVCRFTSILCNILPYNSTFVLSYPKCTFLISVGELCCDIFWSLLEVLCTSQTSCSTSKKQARKFRDPSHTTNYGNFVYGLLPLVCAHITATFHG